MSESYARRGWGYQSTFLWKLILVPTQIFLLFPASRGQSGSCGPQSPCPTGYCCSKFGYCGTDGAYCDPGNCASQCPQTGSCGPQSPCQSGNCCSIYGYCGVGSDYCAPGNCASQCPSTPPAPSSGVSSIASESFYDTVFPQRNGFYTYNAFITAATSFPSFGTTGDDTQKAIEIAAFFAHVSHETGGLSAIREIDQSNSYCEPSTQYPCAPNQKYFGRGPLQISYNYNYGAAGDAIGEDLLNNPDLVATDAVVSFKTAFWFWTSAQNPKPSCHDAILGLWSPSAADTAAGRVPGFGVTIDIINGGLECGSGPTAQATNRINLYMNICGMLNVSPGSNTDCANMQPFS